MSATGERIAAIDRMRGLVMVLMATDHAAAAFDPGRLVTDSVWYYSEEVALPALHFANRWISHLCAPTFLFLAGVSLALSVDRKRGAGVPESAIDRDLVVRGALVLAVDLVLIGWLWGAGQIYLLQVMFAIGVSMWLMVAARRLPHAAILAIGVAALVSGEFTGGSFVTTGEPLDLFTRFATVGGVVPIADGLRPVLVAYPVLPWFAMMLFGWSFGRWLASCRGRPGTAGAAATRMWIAGGVLLAAFVTLRGANGFGNANLERLDGSWIQWLHVSKYPPSLTFAALELGIMALGLAVFFRLGRNRPGDVGPNGPLIVFGQTAFFFYVVHIALLEVSARLTGLHGSAGIVTSWFATVVALATSYPLCRAYRRYKRAHPTSFVRYF